MCNHNKEFVEEPPSQSSFEAMSIKELHELMNYEKNHLRFMKEFDSL